SHGPSRSVAGRVGLGPKRVTLLECIETGTALYPGRMSYVQWLKWRKDTGTRPLKSRDGRLTTSEEEVALRRRVMELLHEMQEGEEEEEEEEEEEDEEDLPPSKEPVDGDEGPELIPTAGDGSVEAAEQTEALKEALSGCLVISDPEAVYLRIKNKVDGEHQTLTKGKLTGPLFEASIADLEAVGLGKTKIRQDKRIWPGDGKDVRLRSPAPSKGRRPTLHLHPHPWQLGSPDLGDDVARLQGPAEATALGAHVHKGVESPEELQDDRRVDHRASPSVLRQVWLLRELRATAAGSNYAGAAETCVSVCEI
ncbi:pol, partial [Symbiodinium sp. CCMP2456]